MNKIYKIVLTLGAIYSVTPLLLHTEFTFGQDIAYHINWATQVSGSIREGVIYPRWLSESNNGYGSPTTIFYAPFSLFLAGGINLIIPSLILSLKVATFIGFLFSGMWMYLFLRNFCGIGPSIAGGVAYQLLPYHMFDIYWRGALAEAFAFMWLPLILHFAYRACTEDTANHWIGLSMSYAGLILTHIVSAYIFTFVVGAMALLFSFKSKNVRLLLKFIMSFILGFSISAVYFIPMVFERRFVHIEWLTEVPWGNYTDSFLFMLRSGGDSFFVHLEQIVILEILLAVISIILIYCRIRESDQLKLSQLWFFSFLFAFSLLITTSYSIPLWKVIPGLQTIQFPWRWVMISTLAAAVLIGLAFDAYSYSEIKRDRFIRVFVAVFHALIIGNIYLASVHIFTAKPVEREDMEWILKDGGDVIEYRPIWLTDKKKDFSKEKRTFVSFKKGEGTTDIVNWESQSRLFKVNTSIPSTVRISTFYYPGWTALVNGKEVSIDIEKDSGAMLLNLPAGENEVLLEFRDTPLRRGAKWVSILSLLAALFGLVMARRKRLMVNNPKGDNPDDGSCRL